MKFLSDGGVFVRNTSPMTDEDKLKYVMSLPHVPAIDCWCEPELNYIDPDTGVMVLVHHYPH